MAKEVIGKIPKKFLIICSKKITYYFKKRI